MLSGTLMTIIGLMPVGFAQSTAGEYAGNIFWIVGFALIVSWLVAVVFTPYLGVKLLPDIKPLQGGHAAIYARRTTSDFAGWSAGRSATSSSSPAQWSRVVRAGGRRHGFGQAAVLPELRPAGGSGRGADAGRDQYRGDQRRHAKVEDWLKQQPEAKIVSAYIGQGAPRFFLSYNPELPDPVVREDHRSDAERARRAIALKLRLREQIAEGLAPEARVRATQLVFGPFAASWSTFRVMGPDAASCATIADEVQAVMRANPHTRQVNQDWGERVPTVHFVLDQDRLRADRPDAQRCRASSFSSC